MPLSIKQVKNYKKWGWDAWILKNEWVTLAVVPDLGGRIMEYALGKTSLIYINPGELGKIKTPGPGQNWPNFGGYKVWPAPQESWQWPPPPVLDHGQYEAEIEHESAESVTLSMKSPVEQWQTPGIRLERKVTLKNNGSKVFLSESLINESGEDAAWRIWGVTQQDIHHTSKEGTGRFWIYFPINPRSRYGASGVYTTGESGAWKGEVLPGVYAVECRPEGKKIFSDSHEGWICFADRTRHVVTANTFPVFHGKSYPDNEARMAVYLSDELPYAEVEVMGPVTELAPGEKSTFSMEWGIAHAQPPVSDVNDVGVVTKPLAVQNGRLTGKYGVFYSGSLYMVLRDLRGVMLKKTLPQPVSPLKPVLIDQPFKPDPDVRLIEVQMNGQEGHSLGLLDTLEIAQNK
jgi:hypothetical protein